MNDSSVRSNEMKLTIILLYLEIIEANSSTASHLIIIF